MKPPPSSIRYVTAGGAATVRLADMAVEPCPLMALVIKIVAAYVPGTKLLAFAFTENVTPSAVVVAVPELDETDSQVGTPEIV